MFDPLAELRHAGIPVDQLSDGQREVLASLSPGDVNVLVRVQHDLLQAGDEVHAQELKLL